MLPRMRVALLLGLPLLFSLGVDAAAQVGRLGGTVAYASPGRPTVARGVTVVAVDANRQAWQTRTDGNGNFVLALRAGVYRVVAQGMAGYTTYGVVQGYVRANADSLITPNPLFLVRSTSRGYDNLTPGPSLSLTATWRGRTSTAQPNNFTLMLTAQGSGNGRLFGQVVYQNGPAGGVTVFAVDVNRQAWQTRTDGNGNFVLALRAGVYRIVAQAPPGYVTSGGARGYVRANDDSVIAPNPLLLMPERRPTPTPTPRPRPTPRQPPGR
jgi:hypothetical protein